MREYTGAGRMAAHLQLIGVAAAVTLIASTLPASAQSCACTPGYPNASGGSCWNASYTSYTAPLACPSPSFSYGSSSLSQKYFIRSSSGSAAGTGGFSPAGFMSFSDIPGAGASGPPGRQNLGMYVTPGVVWGFDGFGGGARTSNDGYALSDSAGLLQPGAGTIGFKENSANGNVGIYADVSGLLPTNQGLIIRGYFDYLGQNRRYDGSALFNLASIGSDEKEKYALGGSLLYRYTTLYARAVGQVWSGHGDLVDNIATSTGNYDIHGSLADLRFGNVFTLYEASAPGRNSGYTKAPVAASPIYSIAFDLSGHVGYYYERADGFTDTRGNIYGDETTKYGEFGVRGKLFAVYTDNSGRVWNPYVAGSVDNRFSFSHELVLPAVPDTIFINEAKTFWGVEGGLDVLRPGGWRIGGRVFHLASSDTETTGGALYVKLPFWNGAPVLK